MSCEEQPSALTLPASSADLHDAGSDRAAFTAMLLQRLPNFGPARYWQLIELLGSPEAIVAQPAQDLASLLDAEACKALSDYQRRGEESDLARAVLRDIQQLQRDAVQVLHPQHPDYPLLLKETHRAPFVLYAKGNLACLAAPQLAMVGSRNPSPGGRDNARDFSAYMASAGFAIASGLALGVDGAAHQGALSGGGLTLAVLGTGIDRIYPHRHRGLAGQILDNQGLLLSEFPPGTAPNPGNFPQRNRIISGLSLGVLVVEAAPKSGSLISARYAMQQGREVFAIPGSIHNPLSRGCHQLIREGATLVETAEDMVTELKGLLSFKLEEVPEPLSEDPPPGLDSHEAKILHALGHDPVSFDLLAARSGVPVGDLVGQLINLEIKGLIAQTPQGYQRQR